MAPTSSSSTHSPLVPDTDFDRRPALRSALPLLATMIAPLVLAVALIVLTAAQSPVVSEAGTVLMA